MSDDTEFLREIHEALERGDVLNVTSGMLRRQLQARFANEPRRPWSGYQCSHPGCQGTHRSKFELCC